MQIIEKLILYKNGIREVSSNYRAPMWWRASGYLAALLPVLAVIMSLSLMNTEWDRPTDWNSALARAEAARENGNFLEARALYSHAGRLAFWHKDWEGVLAGACGITKLDTGKSAQFMVKDMLVQAMIAAEIRRSRVGIAAVARAFALLGEEKTAAMAISRVKSNWPEKVANMDEPSPECWG
jgi:hypothetical protein